MNYPYATLLTAKTAILCKLEKGTSSSRCFIIVCQNLSKYLHKSMMATLMEWPPGFAQLWVAALSMWMLNPARIIVSQGGEEDVPGTPSN